MAMLEELASVEENGTWTLTDLPPGHSPIGLKWVFKTKRDAGGAVVRYKARLVAKGYVQREGVDFDEVFAPVARLDSVRALIAVAAHMGWQVHHLDVKSAFLNGDLKEEVYVEHPPGFTSTDEKAKVFRLRKALYGLRQAPRAWNMKLNATLKQLSFESSLSEHALYTRGKGRTRIILGVYVDDLIITGADTEEIAKFKREMMDKFRMSDLGLLHFYLSIEVHQDGSRIVLTQEGYASKLVERAGMAKCNSALVSMEPRLKLSKDSKAPATNATFYRSVVGCLRYLVHTRPDITFDVGYMSCFMEAPTTEHLAAVKHLLRYIADTLSLGCRYKCGGNGELVGFSDSDMAGDVDDRKSTSGTLFSLGGCPITWQSQKRKIVALSSCEAEYVAAAIAACQGVWLCWLLNDMIGKRSSATTIYINNKSAI
jgi:hypothetical protein